MCLIYEQSHGEKKPVFFRLRQAISALKKLLKKSAGSLIFLEKNNRKAAYAQAALTTGKAIIHILCG
jgi:hypothetical protein